MILQNLNYPLDFKFKITTLSSDFNITDKNGNYVLREDAPPEVRKIHEMLKENYSWIES